MPPIFLQKGEVSFPAPHLLQVPPGDGPRLSALMGVHLSEENCLVQGHTSSQSSPHLTTEEHGGRAALPVIPTQSVSEGLPSSTARCGLSLFRCQDTSTCPSAHPCSLAKWSSKECSLINALRASQSQSLISGNSACDRKVQVKNTLRYNLLTYQIGNKPKHVTPRSVGNIRARSTPTLLVGNLVLSYNIT